MGSTITASEGVDAIVGFLKRRNPDVGEIGHDTDLIENRLLDSLGFVNFVYLLEELTGQEITIDENTTDDFRTINRLKKRFFDDNSH